MFANLLIRKRNPEQGGRFEIIANDHILCDIKDNISTFISIYVIGTIGEKPKGE
jgi:hypothetical protein